MMYSWRLCAEPERIPSTDRGQSGGKYFYNSDTTLNNVRYEYVRNACVQVIKSILERGRNAHWI